MYLTWVKNCLKEIDYVYKFKQRAKRELKSSLRKGQEVTELQC
jgi:hypothetical protein